MTEISNIKYQISNIRFKVSTLLIIFVILAVLGALSAKIFFFNRSNTSNPPNLIAVKKAPWVEPTYNSKITADLKNLPGFVKTYQLKPPPFEIFGVEGQMAIAKALGFTSNAKTYINGNLTFYLEEEKTLVINSSLGTITFFNHLLQSPTTYNLQPTINQDSAKQKIIDLFQSLKLSSPFWGWDKAQVEAFDKNDNPTALTAQTVYYRLEPTLLIGEVPLFSPQPILADVGINGELKYLSFWYPNLENENSKIIKLPKSSELQKMINEKNAIILGPQSEWPKTIDNLKLIYEVSNFSDFAEPVFLEPTLIFRNDKATVKFKL